MKYTNISKDELILLAQDSFKKKNYSKCYSVCSELLKQKAPSVVVYMHSICTLHNARKNDEYLDRQIDNTLLVITALDKFYTNSVVKNENINNYVLDILQTLLLLNIDCAIYTIKSKKQLRSKKKLENSLLLSKQNLETLENFNFESFELVFPRSILDLRDLAVDQILEFIDLSISGSWQAVDEYRLKLTDTYEQIANWGKELNTIGLEGVLKKQQEQIEYEIKRKDNEKYSDQQVIGFDDEGDDVDDYTIYDSLKEKNRKNIIEKKEDDVFNEDSANEEFDNPLDALKQDLEIFEDLKQESKEFVPPTPDTSELDELENEISDIQSRLEEEISNQQKEKVENTDEDTNEDINEDIDEENSNIDAEISNTSEEISEEITSDIQQDLTDAIIEEDEFEIGDVEISVSDELSAEQKKLNKKKKALMIDISIVVVSTIITLLVLTLIMMQFKPDFVRWIIDTIFN